MQASFKPLPAPNKNKMAIGDMENDAGASDDVDADSEKVLGAMPVMSTNPSRKSDSESLDIVLSEMYLYVCIY